MLRNDEIYRFRDKADTSGDCCPWTAGCLIRGNGAFAYGGKNPGHAHRFSYELHHGPIPEDSIVMHACDNRPRVNPAHLRPGTQRDNIHDPMNRGRRMSKPRRAYLHNARQNFRFGQPRRWPRTVDTGQRRVYFLSGVPHIMTYRAAGVWS